jgi:tetratricopeptide (TPR) repeat protein
MKPILSTHIYWTTVVSLLAKISVLTALVATTCACNKPQELPSSIAGLSELLEENPQNVEALNQRGRLYGEQKEYEKALQDFSKALELVPDSAVGYYNRGNTYHEMRKLKEAIADYTKAIQLNKDGGDALVNRAAAYIDLQQFDNAILDLTRSLNADQKNLVALLNRCRAFIEVQKFERAEEDCKRSLEYFPDNIGGYLLLGQLAIAQGNFQKALDFSEKAGNLSDTEPEVYLLATRAYLGLEEKNKAQQALIKARLRP